MGMSASKGATTLDAAFEIPKAGPGITVTKKDDKMGSSILVTRSIPAGAAPFKDVVIKNQKGAVELTGEVNVAKLDNGDLKYTETLHWAGARVANLGAMGAAMRLQVKKVLPERYRKTELIDKAVEATVSVLVKGLLGAPEPIVLSMINPDVIEYKMRARLGVLGDELKKGLPGLTDTEASEMVASLSKTLDLDQAMNPDDKSSPLAAMGGPGGSSPLGSDSPEAMASLTFAVDFPGKMVKTNGIADPSSGLVYWSLLDVSLEFGDEVLEAEVDPRG
jgi:hypothetical protein